ncbi:O-antigen ligase family protein [Pontibacter sp. CAU 1760]
MKVKFVVYYFIILVVLYIQPLEIGAIKITILFNVTLLLYFTLFLIRRRKIRLNKLGRFSLLSAIKTFFSVGVIYSPFNVLVDTFRSLIFPITYIFLFNKFSSLYLAKTLIIVSFVIISSSLFFVFGILVPINSGYDLSIFGSYASGFIGVFENSHSASATLSISIIILLYFLFINHNYFKLSKVYTFCLYITLALGLYILYKTYIRTGYLMLVVGVMVLYLKTFKRSYIIPSFIIGILTLFLLSYLYNNDSTLKSRLSDSQEYSTGDKTKDLGSGRVIFQLASIEIWNSNNFEEKILGMGLEPYKDEMEKKVGLKIYAHNGFTTALLKDGLVGLLLFVFFIFSIYYLTVNSYSQHKLLGLSVFWSYLAYQMVQGGVISSVMELILALIFALVQQDSVEIKQNAKIKINSKYAIN